MFQKLHRHLFQYKTVCIPSVGTFQVVQQPATLDVANQQLLPPQMLVHISVATDVPGQQLASLAGFDEPEATEDALLQFGERFKQSLQQQSFSWQGAGILSHNNGAVHFTPGTETLAPVPAYKVLREGVQHAVLVGDKEERLSIDDYSEATTPAKKRWPVAMVIALTLTLISLIFIGYHLYSHKGKVGATGLQQKINVQRQPLQHK